MPFDGKPIEINSPVITLLREARGRIERGFAQFMLMNVMTDPPRYCALGAVINNWQWDDVSVTPKIEEAIYYVWKGMGQPPINKLECEAVPYAAAVAFYNNNNTQQDVLNAFDKAIELAVADTFVTK